MPGPSIYSHYEVLGLPNPISRRHISTQDIKLAYRRALLQHHPDKQTNPKPSDTDIAPSSVVGREAYTVDEISLAYKVLSDATDRAEYDRNLCLKHQTPQKQGANTSPQTGLEMVDLSDLDFNDTIGIWCRGCRCGDQMGYTVTEKDLENGAEHGEVDIGCHGCSLWLRVLYQPVYDD